MAIDGGRFADHWPRRAVVLGVVPRSNDALGAARRRRVPSRLLCSGGSTTPRVFLGLVLLCLDPLLRPAGLTLLLLAVLVALAVLRPPAVCVARSLGRAAASLAYVVVHILKLVVDRGDHPVPRRRPRPWVSGRPRGSGFPSSHTAVTVALVVGACPWLSRPWRIVGVVTATAIGLDRMYVGAHFPLDVLGGLGIGMAAGGIVLVVQCARRQASAADGR